MRELREEKWEMFHQARTAESHTCHKHSSHISDAITLFQNFLYCLVFLYVSPFYVYV